MTDEGTDLATLVAKMREGIEKNDGDYITARHRENGFEVFMSNMKRVVELVSRAEVRLIVQM